MITCSLCFVMLLLPWGLYACCLHLPAYCLPCDIIKPRKQVNLLVTSPQTSHPRFFLLLLKNNVCSIVYIITFKISYPHDPRSRRRERLSGSSPSDSLTVTQNIFNTQTFPLLSFLFQYTSVWVRVSGSQVRDDARRASVVACASTGQVPLWSFLPEIN